VSETDEGRAERPDDDPPAAGDASVETERAGPPAGRAASPPWHFTTKLVAGSALGVAALGGLYLARNALTFVALSGLLAFLVAPLIRVLQRRARMPRWLALLVSYFVVLVMVVLLGGAIVAGVVSSFSEIDPEEAVESLRTTAVDALTAVRSIEIGGFGVDLSNVVDPQIERLEEAEGFDGAATDPDARPGTMVTVGGEQVDLLLGGLMSSAQVVGGLLTAMLVIFLTALYLSADSHRFHAGLLRQAPPEYRGDAELLDERIGRVWRGYLYGQLINSLATGLLVWLVLWAVGLPGSFVFGLIMALLNMIPTFGPIIAAVPGVLAALALGSTRLDWTTVSFTLLVVAIYIVVVQLQANLMAPFITGQAVSMSPATILIGLLVGFQVGGLVGSLLVVPVLATLKELIRYVFAKLLDRDPFSDDDRSWRRRRAQVPPRTA
jgi:predicted PurR-regulated permease PerM